MGEDGEQKDVVDEEFILQDLGELPSTTWAVKVPADEEQQKLIDLSC